MHSHQNNSLSQILCPANSAGYLILHPTFLNLLDTEPKHQTGNLCVLNYTLEFILSLLNEYTEGVIHHVLNYPEKEASHVLKAKIFYDPDLRLISPDPALVILVNSEFDKSSEKMIRRIIDIPAFCSLVGKFDRQNEKQRTRSFVLCYLSLEAMRKNVLEILNPTTINQFNNDDEIKQLSNALTKIEEIYAEPTLNDDDEKHTAEQIQAQQNNYFSLPFEHAPNIRKYFNDELIANENKNIIYPSYKIKPLELTAQAVFFLRKFFNSQAHGKIHSEFLQCEGPLEKDLLKSIHISVENIPVAYIQKPLKTAKPKDKQKYLLKFTETPNYTITVKQLLLQINVEALCDTFKKYDAKDKHQERLIFYTTLLLETERVLTNINLMINALSSKNPNKIVTLLPANHFETALASATARIKDITESTPNKVSPKALMSDKTSNTVTADNFFIFADNARIFFDESKISKTVVSELNAPDKIHTFFNQIIYSIKFLLRFIHNHTKGVVQQQILQRENNSFENILAAKFQVKPDKKEIFIRIIYIDENGTECNYHHHEPLFVNIHNLKKRIADVVLSPQKLQLVLFSNLYLELELLINRANQWKSRFFPEEKYTPENGVTNIETLIELKSKAERNIKIHHEFWLDLDTHNINLLDGDKFSQKKYFINTNAFELLFTGTSKAKPFFISNNMKKSIAGKATLHKNQPTKKILFLFSVLLTFLNKTLDDVVDNEISEHIAKNLVIIPSGYIEVKLIRKADSSFQFPVSNLTSEQSESIKIFKFYLDIDALFSFLKKATLMEQKQKMLTLTTLFLEINHIDLNLRKIRLNELMDYLEPDFISPMDSKLIEKTHKLIAEKYEMKAAPKPEKIKKPSPEKENPPKVSLTILSPLEEKRKAVNELINRATEFQGLIPELIASYDLARLNSSINRDKFSQQKAELINMGEMTKKDFEPLLETIKLPANLNEINTTADIQFLEEQLASLKTFMPAIESARLKAKDFHKKIDQIQRNLNVHLNPKKPDRTEQVLQALLARKAERKKDDSDDDEKDEKKVEKRPRPLPTARTTTKPANQPISQPTSSMTALQPSPAMVQHKVPMKLLYLDQACKHLFFIRKISEEYSDILTSETAHFALLYNILRCFHFLKMYQEKWGNLSKVNSDENADLRVMIRHHGTLLVDEHEVREFAQEVIKELPVAILNIKKHNLLEPELNNSEKRKALLAEFGLIERTDLKWHEKLNQPNAIISEKSFYKKLQNFHLNKQDNDYERDNKAMVLNSYLPTMKKIIKYINSKGFEMRINKPDDFIDSYLFEIQALRMLAASCGELAFDYEGLNNDTRELLNLCKSREVKGSVGHELFDLDTPISFLMLMERHLGKLDKNKNSEMPLQAHGVFRNKKQNGNDKNNEFNAHGNRRKG